MTAEVLPFNGVTRLDTPPAKVLQAAIDSGMSAVVICGLDAEGQFYFAASSADAGDAGYYLDRAKWKLMQIVDELEAGE